MKLNKKEKIFFLIFIGLSIILILAVNLVIKRYEREAMSSSLSEQKDISPIEPRVEKEREFIEEAEDIEEGPVSGPLLY